MSHYTQGLVEARNIVEHRMSYHKSLDLDLHEITTHALKGELEKIVDLINDEVGEALDRPKNGLDMMTLIEDGF